jgi:hypothetical protein
MHKLQNGSQVTLRPARKPQIGTGGYFSESNDNGAPSYPGADYFNDQIDEFGNALAAMGVSYDPMRLDHLARALTESSNSFFKKHMLFKGMPMSAVGPDPDPDIWLPSGRVELLRADYQTVFEIVSASAFYTDQATIDADPRSYAGHWGTGDGATTFTTDDLSLMMNIKVAGGYGAAGSTKLDHLQNITGQTTGADINKDSSSGTGGAFSFSSYSTTGRGVNVSSTGVFEMTVGFDASRVARTDTYTDSMGLFLEHYRVIPKGVFSYA